jgi:hypothetical protein
MGNQLTKEKVLEINALESLQYEAPEPLPAEEIDVIDEENVVASTTSEKKKNPSDDLEPPPIDEEGQTMLF